MIGPYTKLLIVAVILFLLVVTSGCGKEDLNNWYLQTQVCGNCICVHTPDGQLKNLGCAPSIPEVK